MGKLRPALVINKNINEDRPLFVLKGTTSHNQFYNQSENIRYIDGMRFNCNSIAMLKPHHFLGFIDHIDFHDQRFQNILKAAYELDKHNRLVFSTYEDYIMNTDRRLINILNEANDKSIIKSNCTWQEVYAIYNTLLPHEKLYLGNRFIDSPNTVFRWIVKRNTENAGFIEMYDMKRPGSHRGELIVTVAIWEKYRGMGGLQELQDAAEKFVSSSSKYNRLIWLAKDANKKSIHCAEKLGYTKKFHELDHWVYVKKISKNSRNTENDITRFNNQLNDYDYGIVVDGKAYTNDIDFSKYTTIDPDTFERYKCGTCWDYAEYEAKVFKQQFHFDFTLNALKHDKEFSLYYMEIADAKRCPTHTWLAYRNNGKIYLFESSWKSQVGISKYNTEEEMIKDYIKKHRKENHDKDNPIIVTKYKPNKKFGLTPKEFMARCIYQSKVIYSEINSITVHKS